MTDEMTLQAQRPSAVPYLLGGAAIGGVGGYFVDKTGWNGVPKAKYTSIDDIVKEAKDTFTKDGIPEDLKEPAKKLETARQDYFKYVKDHIGEAKYHDKLATEAADLAGKKTAAKDAVNTAVDDIVKKITNDEIKIDKLDKTKPKEVNKAARKYLKEHLGDSEYKSVKDALDAHKESYKKLVEKAKTEGVSSKKEVIEGLEAEGKRIFEGVKEEAAKFKTANKWWNAAIGATILALGALALRPKAKDQ